MQSTGDNEEKKTQEKNTQFNPSYQNYFEQDSELKEFQKFPNIDLKNKNESKLSLKSEEAKSINIIFKNGNNFSKDKNIKDILSNGIEKSNEYDEIYGLSAFYPSTSLMYDNLEKSDDIKTCRFEEKNPINNKINESNNNVHGYVMDIDINSGTEKEKIINEFGKNVDINNENNKIIQDNYIINNRVNCDGEYEIKKKEKENEDLDENNGIYDSDYKLFYPEEQEKKEETKFEENINKEIKKNEINEKENHINNDNYEIEILNENLTFGQNLNNNEISKLKEKNKHKNKKIKNHDSHNSSQSDIKLSMVNQITTLNIKGLNSNEYYLGEIIEKGPNFPSTLGIVKYMDLILFSENYFGEILNFDEISKKNDFQKIIRLIPVGNKKYIFSNPSSSECEIIKEENDLVILHGKGGQETYYYIMKLTGQINGISEYTIYKVNNTKQILWHFKDSIGLDIEERKELFENNELVVGGITYDIVENPDIEYLLMPGQQFLNKYRKLVKKEKIMEEKKKIIDDKNNYNLNFEKKFSLLREKYVKIIEEKKFEIERKKKFIQEQKLDVDILNEKEQKTNETINQLKEEKNEIKRIEENSKIKINKTKKKYNDALRLRKGLENDNIKVEKDFDENINEFIPENEEELNKEKEKMKELKEKLQKLKKNIYCFECKEKRKEVIFVDCNHLLLCKDCLFKYQEKGNKIKAKCPLCKKINKRLFFISFDE